MKKAALLGGALLICLSASPTMAASSKQPPMNNFNSAYYTCDDNGAFLISYDSDKPQTATMTTSNNSKRYMLKRTPVATGVQFSGGAVTFWTDGQAVTVDGAEIPLRNCKIKSS